MSRWPKFASWDGGLCKRTWSFGWWTGPDGDLVCVQRKVSTNTAADRFLLSPVCRNRAVAFWAFVMKWCLVTLDANVQTALREIESQGDLSKDIELFRGWVEREAIPPGTGLGSFGEILCYEIHSQPDNGRPEGERGLTFKELAVKWAIPVWFLGELIVDHCRRLSDERYPEQLDPPDQSDFLEVRRQAEESVYRGFGQVPILVGHGPGAKVRVLSLVERLLLGKLDHQTIERLTAEVVREWKTQIALRGKPPRWVSRLVEVILHRIRHWRN